MNAIAIIENYYKKDSDLYNLLVTHSTEVMNKALSIVDKHPELNIDREFVEEAAMLHDIGIFLTYAPSIECFGIAHYLCHGYLGREMLEKLGYPEHALVCERHTGVGLTAEEIIKNKMPLPPRDMIPLTIEEKVICFADCFYSKTNLGKEKSVEEIRQSVSGYSPESLDKFDEWCRLFL